MILKRVSRPIIPFPPRNGHYRAPLFKTIGHKSAILVALWLQAGLAYPSPEIPPSFAPPQDQLASRLASDQKSYEQGQEIWIYLDVFNAGDKPVNLATGNGLWSRLQLTDDRGPILAMTKPVNTEHVAIRTLSPGKQTNLFSFYVSGNENAMFSPFQPGRYQAVWPQQAEDTVKGARLAPQSETLTFEVLPQEDSPELSNIKASEIPYGPENQHGLQSRLWANNKKFHPGSPIVLTVELRNAGQQELSYPHPASEDFVVLEVVDHAGKGAAQIGWTDSVPAAGFTRTLDPGQITTLAKVDVSGRFFLHNPGVYKARCPAFGSQIPASNAFQFEIIEAEIKDPFEKALGILIQKCPKDWKVISPRPQSGLQQPGPQWSRVPCRSYQFSHERMFQSGSMRPDIYPITFFMTTARAIEEPWDLKEYHKNLLTDYLGDCPFGHIYMAPLHTTSLQEWPNPKDDILKLLEDP